MKALREARADLVWRDQAHARGHFTNLDDIPVVAIYVVHLLWAAQDFFRRWSPV